MKKFGYFALLVTTIGLMMTACKDEETYAEQKEKERNAVAAFLARDPLLLMGTSGDTLLYTSGINVISVEQFEAQDSTTDVSKNEYVLFANTGVYMQIVRKGVGEKLAHQQHARIITRYWEYNILTDTLQTTNRTPYWMTNPDIMDVDNNSGTITATFSTDVNGGGAMYMTYESTAVPQGWTIPLTYINIGRQTTAEEGIAKVRLIVPHDKGTAAATKGVYPCFYEITYQRMRD
ncbi:MAG: DUF4827 domain-containing protein [Bacteroidaceae bacterium]|nr:DUF4827 domain-containing protein [Bacteroidaceae bacterium]